MYQENIEESLFEKLSGRFMDGTPLDAVPSGQRRIRSIRDHLARLLNTRQGALAHIPDYGTPDIAQVYRGLPGSLDAFTNTVKNAIEKYEPRLENVRLRPVPFNPLTSRISFELDACIRCGSRIHIHTSFLSTGQAKVTAAQAL